jgi:hypothetical protein
VGVGRSTSRWVRRLLQFAVFVPFLCENLFAVLVGDFHILLPVLVVGAKNASSVLEFGVGTLLTIRFPDGGGQLPISLPSAFRLLLPVLITFSYQTIPPPVLVGGY